MARNQASVGIAGRVALIVLLTAIAAYKALPVDEKLTLLDLLDIPLAPDDRLDGKSAFATGPASLQGRD